MYLGIDVGTSAVKAILADDSQAVVADASVALDVSRPNPLWSEQDPEAWWRATLAAVDKLRDGHRRQLPAVRGIGLSGQMHGATLLDKSDKVLRPAILWNDGRSGAECAELERREPRSREITGNLAMPGFTAPKLLWVRAHEPAVFRQIARVLLPKDYVRLCLSGEHVSDMSDSAGTLWMDVARRDWSDAMLEATGLSRVHMPRLVEGSEPAATLRPEMASRWGLQPGVIIAGGGGDNAAGAAGVGTVTPGRAFLSLGTSGVYFVTSRTFSPNPERAVHAFCHCLPRLWHQMSVILSAASCLGWVTRLTGARDEASLVDEAERRSDAAGPLTFLPYLSGERTPHNNPRALGVFFGLSHEVDRAQLGRAVLEGVAFALAQGQDALAAAGTTIETVSVIGGGAKSAFWGRILAAALERPLVYHPAAELGPAFGAARLARLAVTGEEPVSVCAPPPVREVIEPDPGLGELYAEKRERFRRLYLALEPEFSTKADAPG